MRAHAPFALTTLALFLAPGLAAAQPTAAPAEAAAAGPKAYSAAALVGYGFSEQPDSMGIGFGVRAGYVTLAGLYLGGTFVYHLGGRAELVPIPSPDTNVETNDVLSGRSLYGGAEIGPVLKVGPFFLRPYGGVGLHMVTETTKSARVGIAPESSSTSFGPYVAPGITVLYPLTSGLFVGGDARYLFTPLDLGARGVALFATAGKEF